VSYPGKENEIQILTEDNGAENEIPEGHVLRLFVTGSTPRSIRAITNLRAICEEHLAGRYSLEVVDLYQNPELAKENNLVAAPTLIKTLPDPIRRVIGDMSDEDQVLLGLDIQAK
jgi:circadian clock protein KaiB